VNHAALSSTRQQLRAVYQAGLDAVHGTSCVAAWLSRHPVTQPASIVAIGKAACAMTSGACHALGAQLLQGLLITKHGHLTAECLGNARVTCIEAGHPLPDARSLQAGAAVCAFLDGLPAGSTVLFLISGGASSLVEVLPAGVSLELLQRANSWLLGSGLDIVHMNHVRQSLSRIKGGRLLERLRGRTALALLISDVPGDDPAVIGSGLLYPSATPPAPDVALPDWLAALVASGEPQPVADVRVPHHVIASIDSALQAATAHASRLGYRATQMQPRLAGDARAAGEAIAAQLQQQPPGIYLWGGETSVRLPQQPGSGGRNQHLALAAARLLYSTPGCVLLAAGTDGTDGPTAAAGAIVDSSSIARMLAAGLDPATCLQRADAGSCLAASGDLLQTGPTGTNVMDLVIGLRPASTTGTAHAEPV
jgi:hydroxypyruvate reductase